MRAPGGSGGSGSGGDDVDDDARSVESTEATEADRRGGDGAAFQCSVRAALASGPAPSDGAGSSGGRQGGVERGDSASRGGASSDDESADFSAHARAAIRAFRRVPHAARRAALFGYLDLVVQWAAGPDAAASFAIDLQRQCFSDRRPQASRA